MLMDVGDPTQFARFGNHHVVTSCHFHPGIDILYRNPVDVHRREVRTIFGIVSCQFSQNTCLHQFIHQFIHQSDRNAQLMAERIRIPRFSTFLEILDDMIGDQERQDFFVVVTQVQCILLKLVIFNILIGKRDNLLLLTVTPA